MKTSCHFSGVVLSLLYVSFISGRGLWIVVRVTAGMVQLAPPSLRLQYQELVRGPKTKNSASSRNGFGMYDLFSNMRSVSLQPWCTEASIS